MTKQAADLITVVRSLLIPLFIWLGVFQGPDALPLVVWLVIFNWTADSLDGPLARRSPVEVHTWIGDRDLEIDMLITTALLAFLMVTGLLAWQIGALYMVVWLLFFWRNGLQRVTGLLYQAPIYGWFFFVAVRDITQTAIWLLIWGIAALLITWPKFPNIIVRDFIADMKNLILRR